MEDARCFAAVAAVAVTSRLFVVTLQVLFNMIISDHDADAFKSPGQQDVTTFDSITTFLLGGLKRWDAQYFLHIAQYGYTYENTLAFFPLYPVIVNFLGSVLHLVFKHFLSFHSSLLIAGVWINFALFIISALLLYQLSILVLGDKTQAFFVAVLFCFNPASIFFSSCYSETLYSALTFGGLVCLEKNCKFASVLLFAFGGMTRSNGLINVGFLIYSHLQEVVKISFFHQNVNQIFKEILRKSLVLSLYIFLFLCPFVGFQVYACMLYCLPSQPLKLTVSNDIYSLAAEKGYHMPSDRPPPWCNQMIPISYTYIQKTYWNVGFLHYFEIKQIPNFLVASPLLLFVGSKCFRYFNTLFVRCYYGSIFLIIRDKTFVYYVHGAALLVFCSLFIHVQVITRMFSSSSPILYWIASSHFVPEWTAVAEKIKRESEEWNFIWFLKSMKQLILDYPHSRFIIIYFSIFVIIGTALHVNFFPWT